MIAGYANNYLAFISQKNSFGIVPVWPLYRKGSGRQQEGRELLVPLLYVTRSGMVGWN